MKLVKRLAIGVVALVAILYVGFLAGLYFLQRDFQYDLKGQVTALADTGIIGADDVEIATADGQVIHGWYAPPTGNKPVILYMKGNSGSFSAEHERYARWVIDGYGFLAFDYRGFPASPGEVSQTHVLEDATAAYLWLREASVPIVIWGRSLGTGPATYVASTQDADALLLETPFLSAVNVAFERYPFAPVGLLMEDQYPNDEWIKKVDEPVFIAHGTADTTISVSNAERLYELVYKKYELWIEPGAGHSDMWARGLWDRAKKFFEDEEAY